MTNPASHAKALREFADVLESGVLPSREYDQVPLHTSLFFRTEEDRQIAYDYFQANHSARIDSANNYMGSIGGEYLYGGLTVDLIVPSLINKEL